MKFIATLIAALLLGLVPNAASAGGSNDPTPYTVDTEGIALPGADVFPTHGHVNIKYLSNGQTKSKGIHFDPNNGQPGGHWIGRNFIPWSAFGDDIECVTWVQISAYNEHFGEGGQDPVCLRKPPTAPPSDSEQRERDTVINCEERIVEWVRESRNAVFDYDWTMPGWVQTGWTEWEQIDSGFRNEKHQTCDDIPVVGSEQNVLLLGAALLLLIGGTVMVRKANV